MSRKIWSYFAEGENFAAYFVRGSLLSVPTASGRLGGEARGLRKRSGFPTGTLGHFTFHGGSRAGRSHHQHALHRGCLIRADEAVPAQSVGLIVPGPDQDIVVGRQRDVPGQVGVAFGGAL